MDFDRKKWKFSSFFDVLAVDFDPEKLSKLRGNFPLVPATATEDDEDLEAVDKTRKDNAIAAIK
jgi:hypothetical protein